MDNSYLALEPRDECGLEQVLDSSITYRIAIGPPQGLQCVYLANPACGSDDPLADAVAKAASFSLHASVATQAHERKNPERLCRYIARPTISEKRRLCTAHAILGHSAMPCS
jgi:hypothetical protein